MPTFLDDFIHKTLPDFWESIKTLFEEWKDLVGDSWVYTAIVAGAVLVCILLAIGVHRANKRDRLAREAHEKGEVAAKEQIPEFEPKPEMSPIENAIAKADYESIVGIEAKPSEPVSTATQEYEPVVEAEPIIQPTPTPEVEPVITPVQTYEPVQINMEKIELVRREGAPTLQEMTYDTNRMGRRFTEEELNELIQD